MTFDSKDQGTDEAHWAASWLSTVEAAKPLVAGDRLLVLSAHPDDETLGAGGLIASAGGAGVPVSVVIATDGEASHPASPTHSPAALAAIRRIEVRDAVARLHPLAEVIFLGWPDSALADHVDELTTALHQHLDGVTHLASPWLGDRHPDHAACARAARSVAGVTHWQFPIWAWHWDNPESDTLPRAQLRRVDLPPAAVERKAAALACHVSQHRPLSPATGDEAILNESMLAHFRRDYEVFVIADPAAAGAGYFDDLYAQDDDPWGLGERFYEQRKRQLLLSSLPRRRFRRGFEPGSATGLLTESLARRCDQLVAWDGAAAAVEQARARLSAEVAAGSVQIEQHRIPADWPEGEFDLIVLSEVGYYVPDLSELRSRIKDSLAPDGVIVACHWRHPAPDHPTTAELVHSAIGADWPRLAAHEEADFLLEVWSADGLSVAAAEGILS